MRERAFSRFPHETQALSKVVGIADLVAWKTSHAIYWELSPTTVKKAISNSGKADKLQVAADLEYFIGRTSFQTNDESDAVAVGLAWLIQNGKMANKESR